MARLPTPEELGLVPTTTLPTPEELGLVQPKAVPPVTPSTPSPAPQQFKIPTPEELGLVPQLDEATKKRLEELDKEREAYSGFFDLFRSESREAIGGTKAALMGKRTPNEDIAAIAKRHGVKYEDLRSISPFLMATPPREEETLGDYGKRLAGFLGYSAGNIPQFLLKKSYDDPKFREAIDEVTELAEGRTGFVEWVGSLVATRGLGLAARTFPKVADAVTKTAARRIAGAAASGAVFGIAGSKEGEEEYGALIGAGLGGGLGVTAETVKQVAPKVYGKVRDVFFGKSDEAIQKAPPKEVDAVIQYGATNEARLSEAVELLYEPIKDAEENIKNIVLSTKADRPPIDKNTVDTVIKIIMTPDEVALVRKQLMSEAAERTTRVPVVTDLQITKRYIKMRREEFATEIAEQVSDFKYKRDEEGQLVKRDIDEILKEAKRLGPGGLSSKWDNMVQERLADAAIKADNMYLSDTFTTGKTIANALGGRQFGVKVIEAKSGLDVMPAFYQLNSNTNRYTAVRNMFRKVNKKDPEQSSVQGVYRLARGEKKLVRELTSGWEENEVVKALDSGDISKLTGSKLVIAKKIRKFFDDVREFANSVKDEAVSPLAIPKREDFGIPHMTVDRLELSIRMRHKLRVVKQAAPDFDNMTKNELVAFAETNKDFSDFLQGLSMFNREAQDVNNFVSGKQISKLFNEVFNTAEGKTKLHDVAGTALGRSGLIPDFLRETNVFRLMDRYADTTIRNVYTREPLDQLTSKANMLEKMGLKTEANFVRRIVADNYGKRYSVIDNAFTEVRLKGSDFLDKLALNGKIKPSTQRAFETVFDFIPELIQDIQYNIYPNVLGMNLRTTINNMIQTFTKGAPELGGAYGYGKVLRSYPAVISNWKYFRNRVAQLGLEPKGYIKEAEDGLAEGMAKSTGYQYARETYQKVANAWMYTYQKTEEFNRAMIVALSEQVVNDLQKGAYGARRAVERMPPSVQRVLAKTNDPEKQLNIIAKHLNSATAYNYNRASMSEVGVYLGPFLSTLTKWGAETGGDIAAEIRIKGPVKAIPRIAEKYAVIWAIGQVFDAAIYYAQEDELEEAFPDFKKLSPLIRYALGQEGFSSMAPIESLKPYASLVLPDTGGPPTDAPYTSPFVNEVMNGIISPIWKGVSSSEEDINWDRVETGTKRVMRTFIWGGFFERFLNRDLRMLAGEEPTLFGEEK